MRILLDDTPCSVDADTVGEAIALCAERAETRGRFIVEVAVDGETLTDEQLQSPDLATRRAEEVRMTSADPAVLVGQTFAQAGEALSEAQSIQNDAAALLQTDDQTEAMQRLSEAFSIWMSVQQAVVQGSQLVGLDLDACSVNERSAQEVIADLSTRLETLRSQLESKDTVGVADTLLYDLPEVVDQWRDLLDDLQRRVEEA